MVGKSRGKEETLKVGERGARKIFLFSWQGITRLADLPMELQA